MSNEELNRKLAELLGIEHGWECPVHGVVPEDRLKDGGYCPWCGGECTHLDFSTPEGFLFPDYCGDLNAAHEAEEMYFASLRSDYERREKSFEMESHLIRELKHSLPAFRATALQRTEALIKTLEEK